MLKKRTSFEQRESIGVHIFFILFSCLFILPFIYVISISLSSAENIREFGYRLWPKSIDFSAYKFIFANPRQLLDSYCVTIASTVLGTVLGLILMALAAYPLSRNNFKYRKVITGYIFVTMLFNGGMVPTYILCAQYLKLTDKFAIYIVLHLVSAWHIFIIRTFFKGLPSSLVEAAKIDGASELTIFCRIVIPLSKPVLATVAVLTALTRWNDWQTSLIYIQNTKLYSLQYLLQKLLNDAEFLESLAKNGIMVGDQMQQKAPTESMQFAMVVIATGPMCIAFPFFQKYFTKGLTVGAVKG